MNIAFDTNCLSLAAYGSRVQPEQADALQRIFTKKAAGVPEWVFYYLDSVRREIRGKDLSREQYEKPLQKLLGCFDHIISLSRLPFILPVMFVSREDTERSERFAKLARTNVVSMADGQNLADAIGARCEYFVTADMPLTRNMRIKRICTDDYGLIIIAPTAFEALIQTFPVS